MEVIGITADGTEIPLDFFSVSIDREYGVPADGIELLFPWQGEFPELTQIRAEHGGKIVFSGTVDVTERNKTSSGEYIRLEARSPAGVLLDSEARPAVYGGVSAEIIFENHLRPYGIKGYHGRNIMLEGKFSVTKGESEWQVLRDFCRRCYGGVPYAAPDGTVWLEPPEDANELNITDYSAFRERKNRCKLISRVYIKTLNSGNYESFAESRQAKQAGVSAVRYLDASQSGAATIAAAEEMLRLGEENYYTLELTVPGCVLPFPGAKARVGDKITGLFVSKLKYTCSQSGEKTVIQLKRRVE